ncbi:MAG: hypothetical protein ICV83_06635, partial [Cytophagales bacterium]|nr:hypothetical protein [Cytophagales bacterium]
GGVAGLLKRDGVLFITVPHVNKPLEYKHFRHFSFQSLSEAVADHFTVAETVFFENNDWRKDFIDGLLTNRFFILNSNRLKTMLYNYYKKHLFYVDREQGCKRLFMKLIRK